MSLSIQNYNTNNQSYSRTGYTHTYLTPAEVIIKARGLSNLSKETFLKDYMEIFLCNKQPESALQIYHFAGSISGKDHFTKKIIESFLDSGLPERAQELFEQQMHFTDRDRLGKKIFDTYYSLYRYPEAKIFLEKTNFYGKQECLEKMRSCKLTTEKKVFAKTLPEAYKNFEAIKLEKNVDKKACPLLAESENTKSTVHEGVTKLLERLGISQKKQATPLDTSFPSYPQLEDKTA